MRRSGVLAGVVREEKWWCQPEVPEVRTPPRQQHLLPCRRGTFPTEQLHTPHSTLRRPALQIQCSPAQCYWAEACGRTFPRAGGLECWSAGGFEGLGCTAGQGTGWNDGPCLPLGWAYPWAR